MNIQIWNLKGEISGNFFLVCRENLESTFPPYPGVKKFIIDPEFNKRNEQLGKFIIKITFEINVKGDKPLTNVIADIGRDIFHSYVDLLAFLSGYPIRILKPLILTYNYPGTNKYRQIRFPSKEAVLEPPVPLLNTSIFKVKLESKHSKILAWLRRALQEQDVINSILAIFISLEILANQFPCKEMITVTCENCGHVKKIKPGMRNQIKNLLLNEIGYKNERFEQIWNLRNDIMHGKLSISSEETRELHIIKKELILAVIRGMKKLLSIDSSNPPKEILPNGFFTDPLLDVEFTIPTKINDIS